MQMCVMLALSVMATYMHTYLHVIDVWEPSSCIYTCMHYVHGNHVNLQTYVLFTHMYIRILIIQLSVLCSVCNEVQPKVRMMCLPSAKNFCYP